MISLKHILPVVLVATGAAITCDTAEAQTQKTRYSQMSDWNLKAENLQPYGVNPYYHPLKPGFSFVMEDPHFNDDGEKGHYRKEIKVLDEVEHFDIPSIGGKFDCAVVEEKEFLDELLFSRSLNWYCIDKRNNTIYTMGEMAWETKDVRGDLADTVSESWRTGEPDENGLIDAGLIMPGSFLTGGRWMIDCAEGQTMVGGEAAETGLTMATPAGTFYNCVRIREYDLMDPEDVTDKVWAYGVGLVFDTSDGKLIESDALPENAHLPPATLAGSSSPGAKSKPAATPGKRISEEEAKRIALKKVPGEITEVVIERKLGANRYVIEVQADTGIETDVILDVETGEVVGIEE